MAIEIILFYASPEQVMEVILDNASCGLVGYSGMAVMGLECQSRIGCKSCVNGLSW